MTGLEKNTPAPDELRLRRGGQYLLLSYVSLGEIELSAEFLRVHSPSAEVRGHGVGNDVLQVGKADVRITDIDPVGNYAVKLVFSDGHDSGLYSWDVLYTLARERDTLWQQYLARLEAAGQSRQPATNPL